MTAVSERYVSRTLEHPVPRSHLGIRLKRTEERGIVQPPAWGVQGVPFGGLEMSTLIGEHLPVYRDHFEKWMDDLLEWDAAEKQRPASSLGRAQTGIP